MIPHLVANGYSIDERRTAFDSIWQSCAETCRQKRADRPGGLNGSPRTRLLQPNLEGCLPPPLYPAAKAAFPLRKVVSGPWQVAPQDPRCCFKMVLFLHKSAVRQRVGYRPGLPSPNSLLKGPFGVPSGGPLHHALACGRGAAIGLPWLSLRRHHPNTALQYPILLLLPHADPLCIRRLITMKPLRNDTIAFRDRSVFVLMNLEFHQWVWDICDFLVSLKSEKKTTPWNMITWSPSPPKGLSELLKACWRRCEERPVRNDKQRRLNRVSWTIRQAFCGRLNLKLFFPCLLL